MSKDNLNGQQPLKKITLDYIKPTPKDIIKNSNAFYDLMKKRRTVRDFSSEPIPIEVIQKCILTAGKAPSGANMQPWHFVVIKDPLIKKRIRKAAEKEENLFYTQRATPEWLKALEIFETNSHKPFLEEAPYLIAIFSQNYHYEKNEKILHYYVKESVGIATGFLIAALHQAGLATLTHTPSPMGFLNTLLNRPSHEKAFLLLVVGYPKKDVQVPQITKKKLNEITTFL